MATDWTTQKEKRLLRMILRKIFSRTEKRKILGRREHILNRPVDFKQQTGDECNFNELANIQLMF